MPLDQQEKDAIIAQWNKKDAECGIVGFAAEQLKKVEAIRKAPHENIIKRGQKFQRIVNLRDQESIAEKTKEIQKEYRQLVVAGFDIDNISNLIQHGGYSVLYVEPGHQIELRPMIPYEENPDLLCVGEGTLKFES